jgi:hypothetical protein
MPRRFIVRPLAEADLEDATRSYDDERADRTFARIRERPLQFPAVSGKVRRALLQTFPTLSTFGGRTTSSSCWPCCT